MKRLYILIFVIFTAFLPSVFAVYNVKTGDDEYVSDEIYFSHLCTFGKIEADAIHLKKGRLIFYAERENEPQKIETAVMPVNSTEKNVRFRSGDITIASVDAKGVVTPTGKAGETVIEITCGKAKSIMKVSVIKPASGVELNQDKMTLYADRPVTAQLEAKVLPFDATVKQVKWSSSDESVVYVDDEGLVYPNGVGQADVYAETLYGGFKAKCAVTVTTWEKRKENIPSEYKEYDITFGKMVDIQMTTEPTIFTTNAQSAYREEVESFVDPSNLIGGYNKYQFLDLGEQNGISEEVLDTYLKGKGILSGKGATFKLASELYNVSEVYLVIHSCLETGNGKSQLANGIEYNGTTVYNMFGIGAVDDDPIGGGAKYAYEHGWMSPESAIDGGAEWISENYINNSKYRQNTLYKMRWNPEQPGVHQYATDVEWASKQAKNMSAMFEAFPLASYKYEIPVYKGMEKAEIR